jgi:serine/threonine protein kinase
MDLLASEASLTGPMKELRQRCAACRCQCALGAPAGGRVVGKGASAVCTLYNLRTCDRDAHPGASAIVQKVVHLRGDRSSRAALRELRVLQLLEKKAKHCVHFYHAVMDSSVIRFCLEAHEAGTLREFLKTTHVPPQAFQFQVLISVLRGLHELQGAGFSHGDIKPANILLRRDGTVALCDFGLATPIDDRTDDMAPCPTAGYCAAECFLSERSGGPPADIWALGITAWECAAGEHPVLSKCHPEQGFWAISQRLSELPAEAAALAAPAAHDPDVYKWRLIASMIRFDPQRRITTTSALQMVQSAERFYS